MKLYERLQNETLDAKQYLLTSPLIQRCFAKQVTKEDYVAFLSQACLLYTSPSPRDRTRTRMPSSA